MHYQPYEHQLLGFVTNQSLDLLFNHGTQRLGIHDLLAPNTLVNVLPNKDEASEMIDFGADHLLIVRRLEVINEPLDLLIVSYIVSYIASYNRI